jgi:Divergent InlB B-repeat domain
MRRGAAAAFVLAALVLPGRAFALDRAFSDRPDEALGPQIHAVYAVPSDATDNELDTNGVITGWLTEFNDWFASQSGGIRLRIDTSQGQPDITFVRLPQSDAALSAMGVSENDAIRTDFQSAGVNLQDPDKIYAVVVESGNSLACGVGGGGRISAIYLHTCGGVEWQFVVGHEIFHGLGAVSPCALHYSGDGHVTDDANDLMDPYARTSGNPNLDSGHDDYWGPAGDDHLPAGCPAFANIVNSPFLTSHPYFRVSVALNGSGQVYGLSSVPCSRGAVVDECDEVIGGQTPVDLQPRPFPGSHFAGWSGGGCTGTGDCSFTVDADTVLTATFVADPVTRLQIKGKGRLTGSVFGTCAKASCGIRFPYGRAAVIRAVPARHGRFVRWSGVCHGTVPTCTIKPTAALTVGAVFAP